LFLNIYFAVREREKKKRENNILFFFRYLFGKQKTPKIAQLSQYANLAKRDSRRADAAKSTLGQLEAFLISALTMSGAREPILKPFFSQGR